MSRVISIRISDEIANQLNVIAQETERAKSFHVQKALETYIKEYADLQIALDRFNDTMDEVVSSEEMRKMLEL